MTSSGSEGTDIVAVIGHPHFRSDHHDLAIKDDHPAIIRAALVDDRPGVKYPLREIPPSATAYIPISQTMPLASSLCKISPSTSQECRIVSPACQLERTF